MANRSYLYAADSLPTDEASPRPVRCVSEHNWSVPLAHHLLAGRAPAVVPSMIWNGPLGVAADFAGGAELLTGLLRVVGEGEVPDRGEFDAMVTKTVAHLEEQKSSHFLLETGEIVSLGGDEPQAAVEDLVRYDIPSSVARAEAAIRGEEPDWLSSLRRDWPEHFGSFYATSLYFSFPDE
ncbi:hypothetical protein [Spirillospora sp. NPDC047279]|uniref:DUF7822 domain-containing protein n=1 Tax=Spirillospora sp. NPDC047279 TaxID=3155478 RepID=UPI003402C92A